MAFSNLSLEKNEPSQEAEKPETPELNFEEFAEKVANDGQKDVASRLESLYNMVILLFLYN